MPAIQLVFILLASFLIKIPALSHPLTGYFGSYQVINGMMAHMMNWHSLSSLIVPKTFIIIRGRPALHLLYYPFASLCASGLDLLLGGSIDFWGRFQAAFFMLVSSVLIYFISVKLFNRKVSLLAAFLFTFSPMVLISGISFQNEAIGLTFLLASYLILISTSNSFLVFFSGLLFSLALTARIHFLVCFPAFLIAIIQTRTSFKNYFLFLFGSVLSLSAWLGFVYHLDQISDHVMTSFFSQMSEGRVLSARIFVSSKFYEHVLEIITGEWSTPLLVPFLLLSLFSWDPKRLPFILWVLGSLSMFILIPEKATNHPFYLICGIPAVCILVAAFIDHMGVLLNRISMAAFLSFFFLFSLRYYLPPMLSPRSEAFKNIPDLGRRVQSLIPKEDRIIASYGTSPELLYYSERFGWPFGIDMNLTPSPAMPIRHKQAMEAGYGKPIEWLEHLRQEGARYFVVGEVVTFQEHPEFSNYVRKHYHKIVDDQSLIIFDISKQIA